MVQRHWEKIIEKVKEEKHITPLQLILELIHFTMYKVKKKGLRKVSALIRWFFSDQELTVSKLLLNNENFGNKPRLNGP